MNLEIPGKVKGIDEDGFDEVELIRKIKSELDENRKHIGKMGNRNLEFELYISEQEEVLAELEKELDLKRKALLSRVPLKKDAGGYTLYEDPKKKLPPS